MQDQVPPFLRQVAMNARVDSRFGRVLTRVALPSVALLLTSTAAFASDPDPAAPVTYAKDVAPILQASCQECHQVGSIGPMSLMTYEEVRPWADLIKVQVESRNMPPYHYDTGIGIQELKHDGRLTEAQVQTIVSWVDQGSPMGNPADLPAPRTFAKAGEFRLAAEYGQPDVIVQSTPYTVPANGQDRWWQPIVDVQGIPKDRCIRAIETKPSVAGRAVTHHANSMWNVENPRTGARMSTGFLSEYALGKLGEIIPTDACRVAPGGAKVEWDIHYYPNGEEVINDQVSIGIWLYPEDFDPSSLYRQTLTLYYLQGGDYDIPPHGKLMTQGFHSFDHPVRIDSFQPHGHLRLTSMSLETFDPKAGRREMVSMVTHWNPGWHNSHVYGDDVAPLVPAGSVIILTGWYDNSENNRFSPDPDQWVGTGNRTGDEMSHAWLAITHLDQAGYDRLVAERAAKKAQSTAD
jgi:mono/diheme cytochrome c family protein